MNIDPFEPLKVLFIGLAALALGMLIGGVPAYFVGKAHEAEKKGVQIGALATSVESCTVAAKESTAAVKAEAALSDDREARITAAIADGARIAAASARARSTTLATPLRGNDECERVKNAVEDHFWGVKK